MLAARAGAPNASAATRAAATERARIRADIAGILLRSAYEIKIRPKQQFGSDAVRLRRAVSALQRRLRAQDPDGGIPPTSLAVLARLMRTGVTSASEIAALESLQPQSLTRALKSLAHDGLIDRWVDADDRRRTSIAITAKGEALLRATIRERVVWLARVMATRLTADEVATLRAAAAIIERIAT